MSKDSEAVVEIHSRPVQVSVAAVKEKPSDERKLSNGHHDTTLAEDDDKRSDDRQTNSSAERRQKTRDSWIQSEENASLDTELPIHDQIKQGILGFVENEMKKSDTKNPSFIFYAHEYRGSDDKYLKTFIKPTNGHRDKRSPSHKRKKRHTSKNRDRESHAEFEITASSLSALEKVDDYLKEYNKDEVITLSGELEIETNDVVNNNGTGKEVKAKPRKGKRKSREEARQDRTGANKEVSPNVFGASTGRHVKQALKPARPKLDLTAMLEGLSTEVTTYPEHYIDNPFSSPSPMTSPNDESFKSPFGGERSDKIYMQRGGTFRAVARDKVLGEAQRRTEDQKYLRLGDLTPLDIAISLQRMWRNTTPAWHGMLGGLALMHLLIISYSDGLDAGHLSFHAVVTMPYVATYYFLCVCCLISVLDRLDISGLDQSNGLYPYFQPIILVIIYSACLVICTSARMYDEMMVLEYRSRVESNVTINSNSTIPTTPMPVPLFYYTWMHFSVWRAVLSILGLAYFVISNPADLLFTNLCKLLQFKQSLQSIGG